MEHCHWDYQFFFKIFVYCNSIKMKIFIVYPVHLFKNIENLKKVDKVFVVEDEIYFTKYKFHKLKLAFHRATMKKYYDYLK